MTVLTFTRRGPGTVRSETIGYTLQRLRTRDRTFRLLTLASALAVPILFVGILAALIAGAMPAMRAFGVNFLVDQSWNPVTERFGALAPIYGTLIVSFIALSIAVPVGVGIAAFLNELCPRLLRRPIGIAVELLAGIPSIIYGIWGLFVLAPFLRANVQPALVGAFAPVPGVRYLFAGPPYGIGILTAGLVLAIMVLPLVTAVVRDVFAAVPAALKEAAYGLGATRWEVLRRVMFRYTRVGITGAILLGLGRALGETMAVTFVIGNAHRLSASLFAPGTTISATIANEFTEAAGGLYNSTLLALGLILFAITCIVLAAARYLLWRGEKAG